MFTLNNRQLCSSCFAAIKKEPYKKCGFSSDSYAPDKMVLPVGSILMGNFLIGRVLGKGGFGITYQAYDVKYDYIIAIKEYFSRRDSAERRGRNVAYGSRSKVRRTVPKGRGKIL